MADDVSHATSASEPDEPSAAPAMSTRKNPTSDEIRAKIDANRQKRLAVADAMKAEAGVVNHQVWNESKGGLAFLMSGVILSPQGRNIRQLYIVAHECGHIFLHCSDYGRSLPGHVMEFEAESYANQAMKHHGLTVPNEVYVHGCHYVAWWIQQDRERGIDIDPRALAYSRCERSPHEPLRHIPATWAAAGVASYVDPDEVRWLRAERIVRAARDSWAEGRELARAAFENTYNVMLLALVCIVLSYPLGWFPSWIRLTPLEDPIMSMLGTALGVGLTWACLRTLWRTATRMPKRSG